jgi:serine/threonine protein kinase
VPAGSLAVDCEKCGARITLTALETKATPALALALAGREGPPPESLLGRELGGYRLRAILGGGGMGVVYEAERTERATFPGPDVAAVKVLSSTFASDPDFVERFRREAEALTRLRHKNLIEVYAKGEWSDESPFYFFVMERFYGEDLRSLMARGPIDPRSVAAIIRATAEGLAYAHEHGVVHRDVKPANILVKGDPSKDGDVKVVDFGVAQLATGQYTLTSLTRSHLILGTINYMSPEQRVDASEIDHRADVYALGVVAYELLTGRLPIGVFEAPSELLATLPRATDRAILAALRRDPVNRPPTARAFADHLERALVRKSRVPYAVAAVAIAVAGAAAGAAYYGMEPPRLEVPQRALTKEPAPEPQAQQQAEVRPPDPPTWKASPRIEQLAGSMETATDFATKAAKPDKLVKPEPAKLDLMRMGSKSESVPSGKKGSIKLDALDAR